MMLSIKNSCDFCESDQMEFIYSPIKTRRGIEVHVCNFCGLLHSFSTLDYESRPKGSMSANADRSSFRYTKDLVAGRYLEVFNDIIDFNNVDTILDIGSNRGAFIRWIKSSYKEKKITAIEPHPEIPESYSGLDNIEFHNCRFENVDLSKNTYDFAYCVHTLEHAVSAKSMLLDIRDSLNYGGILFLAVPNVIFHNDVIEELFIDPHTFHFNYELLKTFVLSIGFDIIYAGDKLEPDIIFVLKKIRKSSKMVQFKPNINHASKVKSEIKNYSKNIITNRNDLKDSTQKLREAAKSKKVIVWGGGRIFDALVTYGGLEKNDIHMVIDKFLSSYVNEIKGYKLYPPDIIEGQDKKLILIYVASRDYADEIIEEAKSYGIHDFIIFGRKSIEDI